MIKQNATGLVDYLQEGRRRYYYVLADVMDRQSWPFPSDAFPIYRGKSRNRKYKKGDRVSFQAIELEGELRAWKISKIWNESD